MLSRKLFRVVQAVRYSGNRVFVVGVGMTKFEKPGSRKKFDYPDMAQESGTRYWFMIF